MLYQLQREYDEILGLVRKALDEAGDELDMSKVTVLGDGSTEAKVGKLREMNERLDTLRKQIDELKSVSMAARKHVDAGVPVDEGQEQREQKSVLDLGSAVITSREFKSRRPGELVTLEVPLDVKTVLSTGGFPPEVVRSSTIAEAAYRRLELLDLFPTTTTGQNALAYMQEQLNTNVAAEVAENPASTWPEATIAYQEVTEPVRKIAVWIPVTDEVLADESRVAGLINTRLAYFLRERLDRQLMVGDGTAPNLQGILARTGIQEVVGTTTANILDKILEAIVAVRQNGVADADAIVVSYSAWQSIAGAKTTDGAYLFGNPANSPVTQLWGLPLVPTGVLPTTPETTFAVVGAFRGFTELAVRQGVVVEAGYINDDFVKGKQAIRATIRAALAVYRPAAFVNVRSGV